LLDRMLHNIDRLCEERDRLKKGTARSEHRSPHPHLKARNWLPGVGLRME
jgi:hypothetical protein